MKKIITISCVALTLFGATSCGDDFLSVDPSSSVPIDGYYNTESRIMEAVTAAYDPLQWYDYFSGWAPLSLVYDCMSDDVYVGGGSTSDQGEIHLRCMDYQLFGHQPFKPCDCRCRNFGYVRYG